MPKKKPIKPKRKPPRKKVGRGGYDKEILRFAFGLYCKGETTGDIAKRLRIREDCKTVSKKTVDRWRTRHKWELLKNEANAQVFEQDVPAIVLEMKADIKNLSAIKARLAEQAVQADVSSLEGATYAYVNALKALYRLYGLNLDKSQPTAGMTVNVEGNAIITGANTNLAELQKASKRVDRALGDGKVVDVDGKTIDVEGIEVA